MAFINTQVENVAWVYRDDTQRDDPLLESTLKYIQEIQPLIKKGCHEKVKQRLLRETEIQIEILSTRLSLRPQSLVNDNDLKRYEALVELTASEAQIALREGRASLVDLVKAHQLEKESRQHLLEGLATWHFVDYDNHPKSNQADDTGSKSLEGFVMSVKDSLYVRGGPVTCGLMLNADKIPLEDSDSVNKLRRAGAMITTKGSVPMLLFSMECQSNIFPVGKNPYDHSRTVGGSSGGDCALVKSGFVNSAIGSDVAGSARIPALFCGIHGFKPTPVRLSTGGGAAWDIRLYGSAHASCSRVTSRNDAQGIIPTTAGPVARCVRDLDTIMEVLCQPPAVQLDVNVPPLPWDRIGGSAVKRMKLKKRVAVVKELKFMKPSRAAARALELGVRALEDQGYTVVDLTAELGHELDLCVWHSLQCYNKSAALHDIIFNTIDIQEPLTRLYDGIKFIAKSPEWFVRIAKFWGYINGRVATALELNAAITEVPAAHLATRQSFMYRKIRSILASQQVSAILSPGMPIPAVPHMNSNTTFYSASYMFIWNYLKMPAGVMTTTHVKSDEQYYEDDFYDDTVTAGLKEAMAGSIGLPVGISISAPVFEDEVAMEVMMAIEKSNLIDACEIRRCESSHEERTTTTTASAEEE
eukprot:GHVH01006814.1.p1 GENE.GHVH01006814.1~~GHVH01006814.1.p1  ORF type:complete len:642 (-),score=92.33 GHVH01006814.1:112-2037(-)